MRVLVECMDCEGNGGHEETYVSAMEAIFSRESFAPSRTRYIFGDENERKEYEKATEKFYKDNPVENFKVERIRIIECERCKGKGYVKMDAMDFIELLRVEELINILKREEK